MFDRYWMNDMMMLRDAMDCLWDDGVVYVHVSGVDCDHCSYGYSSKRTSLFDAFKCVESAYANAEGRVSCGMYSEPMGNFRSRDYILEAFENGHPYSVDY